MPHSERRQNGRVQIAERMRALYGEQSDFVRSSDALAGFHTAAGHPDGEPGGAVLTTFVALHHRRSTEFTRPDHQRAVQQAALLEVVE